MSLSLSSAGFKANHEMAENVSSPPTEITGSVASGG